MPLETLAAELGALGVRAVLKVLRVLMERSDDLDCTARRGERGGMGGGGGGGIGIEDGLMLSESTFLTSDIVDLFFNIGLSNGRSCKLI